MKKSFFDNWDEMKQIVDTLAEYDETSALVCICLMIDTLARTSEATAPELAALIADQVKAVNAAEGAY